MARQQAINDVTLEQVLAFVGRAWRERHRKPLAWNVIASTVRLDCTYQRLAEVHHGDPDAWLRRQLDGLGS